VNLRQFFFEELHGVVGLFLAPFGKRVQGVEFGGIVRPGRRRRSGAAIADHLLNAEHFTLLHATPPVTSPAAWFYRSGH